MSKQVIFSFDDGRVDTYTTAMPIMNKYNITATLNITSDFVNNPESYDKFASSGGLSMTPCMIQEAYKQKFEIACHGHTHKNTIDDIRENINWLKHWGIDVNNVGFASPHSYIDDRNLSEIQKLIDTNTLKYVRSGIQTRREGLLYAAMQYVQEKTHSPVLFSFLNKRLFVKIFCKQSILYGVSITCNTTVNQIKHLIKNLKDGETCILMFHSILNKNDKGYGMDKWYWDASRFEELCEFFHKNSQYKLMRTIDLVSKENFDED